MLDKLVYDPEDGYYDENGVVWATRAAYLKQGVLPLCDCGDSDAILRYIVEMFRLHVGQSTWDTNRYEDMPTMFFLSWASNQDYIEHGATIRCSWITSKGEELLKDIETVLSEGVVYPMIEHLDANQIRELQTKIEKAHEEMLINQHKESQIRDLENTSHVLVELKQTWNGLVQEAASDQLSSYRGVVLAKVKIPEDFFLPSLGELISSIRADGFQCELISSGRLTSPTLVMDGGSRFYLKEGTPELYCGSGPRIEKLLVASWIPLP